MIGTGVSAATAFKKHVDVKIQGLGELQTQLDFLTQRLSFFETGDPVIFASDLTNTKAAIKELKQEIAT